jgi:glycosyltransferase involved in cell wall biosynthesis
LDVLFVQTPYAPDEVGGAEISIRDFVSHAAKRNLRAGVFTAAPVKMPEVIQIDGAPVMRAPIANLYHPTAPLTNRPLPLRAAWHAINLAVGNPHFTAALKRFRPRVVCTNNLFGIGTQAWAAARESGARVVHFLHDYHLLCTKGTLRSGSGDCASLCTTCSHTARIHRARSRAIDLVLANSDATLQTHLENGFFENIPRAAVGVGVNVTQLSAAGAGRKRAVRTLGYLGRLSPEKGIDRLLRAFARSAPRDATLAIAGAGDAAYTRELKTMAQAYGAHRIRFVGRVNAAEFLAGIDVLVAPSLWREPFGRTVIEGMSAGCLVIAPRTGGLAELIGEGDRGIPYEGEDGLFAAIAKLQTLTAVEADAMRATGAEFAQRFARGKVCDALYDHIAPLLARQAAQ